MRVPREDIKNWFQPATECDKCGKPFEMGQSISGHETSTWHSSCENKTDGGKVTRHETEQHYKLWGSEYDPDTGARLKMKTDGGEVTRTSTEDIKRIVDEYEAIEDYWRGVNDAKDLMYHVYGLDPESSTWDKLGKRGK